MSHLLYSNDNRKMRIQICRHELNDGPLIYFFDVSNRSFFYYEYIQKYIRVK